MPRDDIRACVDPGQARYLMKHYIRLELLILRNSMNEHITDRALDVMRYIEKQKNFPRNSRLHNGELYYTDADGVTRKKAAYCWLRLARLEAKRRFADE